MLKVRKPITVLKIKALFILTWPRRGCAPGQGMVLSSRSQTGYIILCESVLIGQLHDDVI